jgi:hypothetical protein
MNKTPAFKVPLQMELRFHLRWYEQPPTLEGPRGDTERWLKGTNFHKVVFLQRQGGRIAGVPHPGARKVERRDA